MSASADAPRDSTADAAKFKETLFKRQMLMYHQYRQLTLAQYKRNNTNISETRMSVRSIGPTAATQRQYYKVCFGAPINTNTTTDDGDLIDATQKTLTDLTDKFYDVIDSNGDVSARAETENASIGSTRVSFSFNTLYKANIQDISQLLGAISGHVVAMHQYTGFEGIDFDVYDFTDRVFASGGIRYHSVDQVDT